MPKMPEKDPSLWAAALAWLSTHQSQVYAFLLSIGIAVLRVIYGGGPTRQVWLEGALCGALTLAVLSGSSWLGIPEDASAFIGSVVGFVGVKKIGEYADRWLGRKADSA
ncbi:TPA: phage holin, lambda family [Pseudomonas aeruginosa]